MTKKHVKKHVAVKKAVATYLLSLNPTFLRLFVPLAVLGPLSFYLSLYLQMQTFWTPGVYVSLSLSLLFMSSFCLTPAVFPSPIYEWTCLCFVYVVSQSSCWRTLCGSSCLVAPETCSVSNFIQNFNSDVRKVTMCSVIVCIT